MRLWSQDLGDLNVPGLFPQAPGTATTVTASGTTTATATLNSLMGTVTSASLTTAAAATYALTLSNSMIAAGDMVLASVGNGSNTTGAPNITTITVSAGQVVINVQNIAASAALNGTIKISFYVLKNASPQ